MIRAFGSSASDPLDQFRAVHPWHAVIRSPTTSNLPAWKSLRPSSPLQGDLHATSDLFQQAAADQQPIAIVVDQRMFGVERVGVFIGERVGA